VTITLQKDESINRFQPLWTWSPIPGSRFRSMGL